MTTCADVEARLDAFVDGELPPSESVDVARHASGCAGCDGTMRDMLAVREALLAASERRVDAFDLSGIWPHVQTEIARGDAQASLQASLQASWRERVDARRRVPRTVVWGTVAAMAAGLALLMRPTEPPTTLAKNVAKIEPVAESGRGPKRLPNHVYIDRLAGKDIALRREPKSGTTMIWVNHEVDSSGW